MVVEIKIDLETKNIIVTSKRESGSNMVGYSPVETFGWDAFDNALVEYKAYKDVAWADFEDPRIENNEENK